MTFEMARKELETLANGKFRRLEYGLTEFSSGGVEAECKVYVDGQGYFSAPDWRGALDKLKRDIDKYMPVDENERPEEIE